MVSRNKEAVPWTDSIPADGRARADTMGQPVPRPEGRAAPARPSQEPKYDRTVDDDANRPEGVAPGSSDVPAIHESENLELLEHP